ncbi:neuraminidase [Haloferula helveola]|uniref:Neuraminidase n=1 Tax=Haloferula helveola TaxID=490095 RepID=A0ABM7R9D7_9BACT|nr:neuraminidase [Haloferula helveola]
MRGPSLRSATILVPLLAVGIVAARAELLFFDDFDGDGSDLHGSVPDTSLGGAAWTASSHFNRDGSTGDGPGSATLPFTPVDGRVYALDARYVELSAVPGDTDWFAVGFVNGQSAASGTNDRFITGNVVGVAWALARGDFNLTNNNTFLGTGQTGSGNHGIPDGLGWSLSPAENAVDLRVVLDTTAGAGNWTATFYAKRPVETDYTLIRATEPLLSGAAIGAVGLARSNPGVSGMVESFSLTLIGTSDSDEDGLTDTWEILHFREDPGESDGEILSKYAGTDDPDNDGFDNAAEETAGTDPNEPLDRPMVAFIPVTDGNPATDENGYAGSSINSVAFLQNNLITVGDQQFIAYYRRHASDPGDVANNTIAIGRRNLDGPQWEIFPTTFLSNNINDAHDVISCAIDGDGFLHMSWGMHADAFHYAKSDSPVLGAAPIVMIEQAMTGQENAVTYPKFQTLPDGDVLYFFREGGSGNGDWFLNRYDIATDAWAPVHADGGGTQVALMRGRGDSPDNCFYPDRMTLGPDGMLHLAGVFRYNGDSLAGESGYQTNHRYVYLRSPDDGVSWERSDGTPIDLPVVEADWFLGLGASHVPEIIEDIPEGYSIINESGMTTDSEGRPVVATWWATGAGTGDHTRQYQVLFHDGSSWQRRTISARDIDDPATKFSEGQLGSSRMGRPVVLTDSEDRIIVIYNDNRADGITAVFSLPKATDPGRNQWTRMNLTHENLGNWETTYDESRWKRDEVLHIFYQKLPGMGASYSGQNLSTPVSVLEWDVEAYFGDPVHWKFDTSSVPGQAVISAPTRAGFRYDLRTSTDLLFTDPPAATLPGNGAWQEFGSWPLNEGRRFWQLERVEEAANDL